jgi:phosphatidylglycerophosphate synthase
VAAIDDGGVGHPMFSVTARDKMLARGVGLSSFLRFFADSIGESLHNLRDHPAPGTSIARFSAAFHAAVLLVLLPLYLPSQLSLYGRLAAYTALSFVAFTGWLLMYVGLIRGRDGSVRGSVGLANHLTAARFYLIVPVVVLLAHGKTLAALVLYVVLGLTDIADGIVARKRGEQTEFGVVMDPLADVFSTAAVFGAFLAQGLIPLWLFLVLMLRYAMLIVGSFVLFLATGPIPFRATIPGKIVGIIQGMGIIIIVWCVWRGADWETDIAPVLFPVLGLVFASIIVSQGVIGYLHLRRHSARKRKAVDFGS